LEVEFEDTKGEIRIRKPKNRQRNGQKKKNRQRNGQKKKDKQQSAKHYTELKIEQHERCLKLGVNSDAPEE